MIYIELWLIIGFIFSLNELRRNFKITKRITVGDLFNVLLLTVFGGVTFIVFGIIYIQEFYDKYKDKVLYTKRPPRD